MKLTKKEILNIPKLKDEGISNEEIARRMKVHPQTIYYWIKRLRESGYEVKIAKRKSIQL
jgi:transposase